LLDKFLRDGEYQRINGFVMLRLLKHSPLGEVFDRLRLTMVAIIPQPPVMLSLSKHLPLGKVFDRLRLTMATNCTSAVCHAEFAQAFANRYADPKSIHLNAFNNTLSHNFLYLAYYS
jgi:hypothetical protein